MFFLSSCLIDVSSKTTSQFSKNSQESKNDRLFASNIKVLYSILIFLQVKSQIM